MPATFDVFTKRTKLFYILGSVTIIFLAAIALCAIFNIQPGTHFTPLINVLTDTLIIAASFAALFFLTAMASGLIRTYIKTGELILADDYVVIEGSNIPLNEAKDIRLKVGQWSRRQLGSILRNCIEITDKNGKTYKSRFVIKSYNHNQDFEKVLLQWQTNGVAFEWKYNAF